MHEDALKTYTYPLKIQRLRLCQKFIDHSLVIGEAQVIRKPKSASKMKVRMVKAKVPIEKTSRLEKATAHLYDLEDACEPEKQLNIDFDLYQMEDY